MPMFLFVVPSEREFDSVAEVLRAAASPLRLMILTYLNRTPMSVQQLADELAKGQPLVSHHLKILRQAGLVSARREGRRAIYVTTDDPVVGLAVSAVIHHREKIMTTAGHTTHTGHDHAHGEGCGHVSVPHGDHVDYLHDGHLHRAHDDHWDECETADHIVHDDHSHVHGEGCGHAAVPHRDHVDYLHDGHRHAAHDGHYDEH